MGLCPKEHISGSGVLVGPTAYGLRRGSLGRRAGGEAEVAAGHDVGHGHIGDYHFELGIGGTHLHGEFGEGVAEVEHHLGVGHSDVAGEVGADGVDYVLGAADGVVGHGAEGAVGAYPCGRREGVEVYGLLGGPVLQWSVGPQVGRCLGHCHIVHECDGSGSCAGVGVDVEGGEVVGGDVARTRQLCGGCETDGTVVDGGVAGHVVGLIGARYGQSGE